MSISPGHVIAASASLVSVFVVAKPLWAFFTPAPKPKVLVESCMLSAFEVDPRTPSQRAQSELWFVPRFGCVQSWVEDKTPHPDLPEGAYSGMSLVSAGGDLLAPVNYTLHSESWAKQQNVFPHATIVNGKLVTVIT